MRICTFLSLCGLQSWEYISSCGRSKCKPGMCSCQLYPPSEAKLSDIPPLWGQLHMSEVLKEQVCNTSSLNVLITVLLCGDRTVEDLKVTINDFTNLQPSNELNLVNNTKSSKAQHTVKTAGTNRLHGLFLTFKNWFSSKSKWGFIYKTASQPMNAHLGTSCHW